MSLGGGGGDSISSARISYESFGDNGRILMFRSISREESSCTRGEIYFIGRFVTFVALFGR